MLKLSHYCEPCFVFIASLGIAFFMQGCESETQRNAAANSLPSLESLHLKNNHVQVVLTPQAGGRVIALSVPGFENILSPGTDVVIQPETVITPSSNRLDYRGHIIWLGPQSEWWVHQQVNATRAQAKSVWPPDPYVTMARNKVVEHSEQRIELKGVESPVSGMRVNKTFALPDQNVPDEETQGTLVITATAENITRDQTTRWDLWMNTRVTTDTRVYVPVAGAENVRLSPFSPPASGEIQFLMEDGILALNWEKRHTGAVVEGKLFIQPSAGWMAAFTQEQLFIIGFDLLPESLIHPEQGQVELYLQTGLGAEAGGVIEIEQHAAYKTLVPGQSMSAQQRWRVMPYTGGSTPNDHRNALRALGL